MLNHRHLLSLTVIALAALSGCSTVPASNAQLEQARSDLLAVQANPQSQELAGSQLKQANDALNLADAAWARRDAPTEVDHLSYLAKQRVAIVQQAVMQKSSEAALAAANKNRDTARLAARTSEADSAQRSAQSAQLQSEVSQQQASDAQSRTREVEAQLAELKNMNAKQTDRGMVLTLGDVLFDSDQAHIKPGAQRSLDKLVIFLKRYPQRRASVEGYTDSTGNADHNQELSARRAGAVRTALVERGVEAERIVSQGYGESYPVAGNDSSGGRQQNRRVEIILSGDSGTILPR